MKFYFKSSLFIFLLFALVSCKKKILPQYSNSIDISLVNERAINQVIELNNGSQILAYKLLNHHEKAFLWSKRIDAIESTAQLTKNQISFLHELKPILTSQLFLGGSSENLKFRYTLSEYYKNKGKSLFNVYDLHNILAEISFEKFININKNHISPSNINSKVDKTSSKLLAVDCSCNIADDWCASWTGQELFCAQKAEIGLCIESNYGCGTLLLSACNGLCWPIGT